jgi:hypothetical protein
VFARRFIVQPPALFPVHFVCGRDTSPTFLRNLDSTPNYEFEKSNAGIAHSTIGLTPLARGGAEVVGASGFEAGPLGGGTSIDTEILLAFKPLRPAGPRVLPRLLPPVGG